MTIITNKEANTYQWALVEWITLCQIIDADAAAIHLGQVAKNRAGDMFMIPTTELQKARRWNNLARCSDRESARGEFFREFLKSIEDLPDNDQIGRVACLLKFCAIEHTTAFVEFAAKHKKSLVGDNWKAARDQTMATLTLDELLGPTKQMWRR